MVTISETAAEKIKELLEEQDARDLFLRLGVKAGGCSGFSYGMGFDDDQKDDDKVMDIHGVKVVVDSDSYKYLNGVEIDYKDQGMGGGFTIHNPNAIATCGCGSSFRTREEDEALAEKCD